MPIDMDTKTIPLDELLCPTCKKNYLTPEQRTRDFQCDECARREDVSLWLM